MRRADYLPIEIVFNLLCLHRKGMGGRAPVLRLAWQKRRLQALADQQGEACRPMPRLSFWRRLCQAAALLDESPAPYPTLLADEWVGWSFWDQIAHLLAAWQRVHASDQSKSARANLLYRLSRGAPVGASQRRELVGLQALGVCEGEQISRLGQALLSDPDRDRFTGSPPQPWLLEGQCLCVPFPPDWKLVWELERFLTPAESGVTDGWRYPLEAGALRAAAQRGASQNAPALLEILEHGLGKPPPAELARQLAISPVIRLTPGWVLEFSHPDELKRLRQSPGLRRKLDRLLSPRHVALDRWQGYAVIQRLYRQGLLSEADLAAAQSTTSPARRSPDKLNQAERVYLLSLLILAEGLQNTVLPPPGLLAKLTDGLGHSLRAAAARKATAALKQIRPQPTWQPDEASPKMSMDELARFLQDAIEREQAVDILYQASGRHAPEYRHVTPLLIEARGERSYLVAYCHLRRANRTFRLDRVKLWVE